jgi:hypothetical protein
MSSKIYVKRGATNYKEKRLIEAIQKAIVEKGGNVDFSPATNFEELKALHNELCIESADFVEVKNENGASTEEQHKEFRTQSEKVIEKTETQSEQPFVDPFNEHEPIVRDYVTDNGFKEEGSQQQEQKTTFDEPNSYKESFDMPTAEDEKGGKGASNKNKEDKKEKVKAEPLNPKFDDMDNGKKKRSTKKFAKLIVDGVCLLAEKGCIWWTTKDITDDKLAQYELEDTMDLQILLTLDDNQQQPVAEWFRSKVKDAQTLFKVEPQDKQDLIDSLYEVMLEKGIAPTPMQELIINAVKTLILDMGLKAYQFGAQINNVLTQLKTMHQQDREISGTNEEELVEENPATAESNQEESVSTELATTN